MVKNSILLFIGPNVFIMCFVCIFLCNCKVLLCSRMLCYSPWYVKVRCFGEFRVCAWCECIGCIVLNSVLLFRCRHTYIIFLRWESVVVDVVQVHFVGCDWSFWFVWCGVIYMLVLLMCIYPLAVVFESLYVILIFTHTPFPYK